MGIENTKSIFYPIDLWSEHDLDRFEKCFFSNPKSIFMNKLTKG